MLKKIIFVWICILLFYCTEVFADSIYLKNGSKISGIITEEDENSVKIKINIGAIVAFSKQDIERIERQTDVEHARITQGWESEKALRAEQGVGENVFVKEEKEGLVEYKGEWIAPEEKERLQAANIAIDANKRLKERRFWDQKDHSKRSTFAKKLFERGKWFMRETEHFVIFYENVSQAKIVSDKAEYYFEKITYDLAYEGEIDWDMKCQVYIVESVEKWRDFLKDIGFNADLVGGFVPNYAEKEMFLCTLSEAYLALTFPHELTHLIFGEIAGKNTIPLWLNEGLANYEASVTSISNELLIQHIRQGSHILLGDLLRMTGYPEGKKIRELFYAQSEKLVEFLIVQHGRQKFRKFCEFILKDRAFNDALFSVYGEDFADIEDFNIKLVEYIVE